MGLTDQAIIRKYEHEPLSYVKNYAKCVIHTFITKQLIAYFCINYNAIKIATISNFCHDTNHYHLVRLYDDLTTKRVCKKAGCDWKKKKSICKTKFEC